MIEAIDIAKTYQKRTVIQSVSFQVNQGEVVGLLGPNGAGKTTCFYMVVGLIGVDQGQINIDGFDATKYGMHERAKLGLGYLPQEASVFRKLSVKDNVMAVLELRKDLSVEQRKNRCLELLEELNVEHVKNQLGVSLSGGERRRVEIARCLALEPKYILLDEPFAGVDPVSVIDIQKIVQHLKSKKIGVLITDHNVRETLGICDRAYILNDGKMLTEGKPEQIISNADVKKVYLGQDFSM
ncbi:LPS export ABC transporter ATP-binding protein [Marinicella sp. S1101]|uniref:LPS export ABC transporter ATP-binding protein n=1 Tax=Marinicella marina TaxID=2996016 RepID=UPI002260D580|nr:LPS export ABC transporter ATP-binding protein [Marinicella marina]MCX7554629.1 LPS export ABC transporter ATP-binding protein [Marinicella marina]MDJ1140694.1 LPS export ABC transporter ATP-binding protein [Marinicella marina]